MSKYANSKLKFRIRLKDVHDASGKSAYRVAQDTGISKTTVGKYVDSEEVISDILPTPVITLARYYGVDWKDERIVEIVSDNDPDPESEGNRKTPLLATA